MQAYVLLSFLDLFFLQDPTSQQVSRLLENLRSEKALERDEATLKLKSLGSIAKVEVAKLLRDRDPEVALRAAGILRVINVRERLTPGILTAIHGIDEGLASDDRHVWTQEFLRATEYIGNCPRYPTLATADLESLAGNAIRGAQSYRELKQVLKEVEERLLYAASPEVTLLLSDPRMPVRVDSLRVLGKLGVKGSAPQVIQLLSNDKAEIRTCAAETLGSLDAREAIALLKDSLRASDTNLCSKAAKALGDLGALEACPDLASLLKAKGPQVRSAAVDALGMIGSHDVVPACVLILEHGDPEVRADAVRLLGLLDAKAARVEIEKLLSDNSRSVRRAAAKALAEMGVTETIADIARLLAEAGPDSDLVRGDVAVALATLDARKFIPQITKLLMDESSYVRALAADALGRLGAVEQADDIAKLIQDKDWIVACGAMGALSRMKAVGSVPEILQALSHDEAYVRRNAVLALEKLDARNRVGDLARVLSDPSVLVRVAAAEALCRAGSREGVSTLLKECGDLRSPIVEGDSSNFLSKSLFSLNALRNRNSWLQLGTILKPVEGLMTRKQIVESAAMCAGFSVDWSTLMSPHDDPWITACREVRKPKLNMTVIDSLTTFAQGPFGGTPRYEIILEQGSIRVVSYDDALKFWMAWSQGKISK